MTITAVNTLEIWINQEADSQLEPYLQACVARIQHIQGCLGYSLIRSSSRDDVWIMSGYWSSATEMTAHFSSAPMTEIVSALIESCANLTFASFTPMVEQPMSEQ
ncbi:antibiotic biosynthesis monooxygenase [Pseudomonas sp. CDFA 553]|uniref:antibiotic biosynthesis monooxygenase family protein n=1 Tax=Pseudomonas quasicaspiana TaxID=2829821 RepID=UPI001E2B374A|nr:antibiotic biosynthesis monooxygenase family protein [Pseudomonas quasicaspiana]MCD5989821.1 antibiotic biosynthesis monooxygenase [Pseudomonas quasicaspiana]